MEFANNRFSGLLTDSKYFTELYVAPILLLYVMIKYMHDLVKKMTKGSWETETETRDKK